MLTYHNILESNNIRLYAGELLCVISPEDNTAYWFSRQGLPWGTRENPTFLQHRNFSESDGISVSGAEAMKVIEKWKSR